MTTVHLTQYLRPDGREVPVSVELSEEHAERAREMILTCEVLMTGHVAIYGRFEDEEFDWCELATNEPGPKQPDVMTAKVIDSVWKRRHP